MLFTLLKQDFISYFTMIWIIQNSLPLNIWTLPQDFRSRVCPGNRLCQTLAFRNSELVESSHDSLHLCMPMCLFVQIIHFFPAIGQFWALTLLHGLQFSIISQLWDGHLRRIWIFFSYVHCQMCSRALWKLTDPHGSRVDLLVSTARIHMIGVVPHTQRAPARPNTRKKPESPVT